MSAEWIKKNILRQTDEEIKEMQEQMDKEAEEMGNDQYGGDPNALLPGMGPQGPLPGASASPNGGNPFSPEYKKAQQPIRPPSGHAYPPGKKPINK